MDASTKKIEKSANPAENVDALIALLKTDESEREMLYGLLMTATDYAERYLGRSLLTCKWVRAFSLRKRKRGLSQEYFIPKDFMLPYPPVVGVEEVRGVLRGERTALKTDSYYADVISEPAVVMMTSLGMWESVEIEYTAGYGDSYLSVPDAIRQGILRHCAYMYNYRGDCPADDLLKMSGAKSLYDSYRVGIV